MTPNRPGWWRGRGIEGADCDEWACWDVRENPDSCVGWFFYFFGYWYPLSEMQEWGERVPMPDEAPDVMPGGVASR